MKTQVDIITGFLGSGKTKLINDMLGNESFSKDKVVVIQCEAGETEIDSRILEDENIWVKEICKQNSLDTKYINEIIKEYLPSRIIIEANGMDKLENLLNTFDDSAVKGNCVINKIVHTIDGLTFDIFMNNMGGILADQISNSDFIVLNNIESFAKEKLNNMKRTLKEINKSAKIVREVFIEDKKTAVNYEVLFLIAFTLFSVGYLVYSIFKPTGFDLDNTILSWLQVFNTIFLSILVQAFPFILFGVFISSIIQVFVSSEVITKLFPKEKGLGFIAAIFAGFLFPVCDCGIVPVGARLVKKGVPLPTAITFMLAAPIMNPIVIASTLYAFPGQHSIALYRIYLGIIVAFSVGLVFMFFPEEKSILLNNMNTVTCSCGFCSDDYNKNSKGVLKKVDAIFKHAGSEFFEVGRFLIVGSFLSTIMQTIIPKDVLANLGGGNTVSLLIMMILAFVLSVCSTSDAFIARTFINQFPIGAVMGFLILGPMVDIKNLLMLLGNFQKRFVVKLVLVIFAISFIILLFSTSLF